MKKSKKKEIAAKSRESVHRLSFVDRNTHFLLPALLLGALLVRILALTNFSQSFYRDFLLWDEQVYQAWASHILEGKLFVVHDFSLLPAYVMATVYRLLSDDPDYVHMVEEALNNVYDKSSRSSCDKKLRLNSLLFGAW